MMTCCGISGGQAKLLLRQHGILGNPGLGSTPRISDQHALQNGAQASTSASLGKRCKDLLKKIGFASLECFVCLLTCNPTVFGSRDSQPVNSTNAGGNRLQNHASQFVGALPPQSVVVNQADNRFTPSVGFNPTY